MKTTAQEARVTTIPADSYSVSTETLATYYQAVIQYLRRRGDYSQLAVRFCQQVHELEGFEPTNTVPVEVVAENMDRVAQWIDEPCLGLKVAPDAIRLQGRLALFFNESPLAIPEYLQMLKRYIGISSRAMEITIMQAEDALQFALQGNTAAGMNRHLVEGYVSSVCEMVFQAHQIKPTVVEFCHSLPNGISEPSVYFDLLRVRPVFECEKTLIKFPLQRSQKFEYSVTSSEQVVAQIRKMEGLRSRKIGAETYESRCRHLIEILLYYGEPSKNSLADVLSVSPRTLQRRLEDEGQTFRSLLRDIRMRFAQEYVLDRSLSSEAVAFMLGFQDVAHYFKSFKSWFGMSPLQYRKQHGSACR
ncbi:arabinose-binding AraC family transcriptional regulator [Oleiphilus messinensis]|uniref:Arabinose-binding AraC family transcriptional regulator n=1 Tax=Oleiphilus messinensis TaxID=141451 RepID=A0A1Y0IC59_9GAMM|nr:helix-turn-helix transcriptional regulator [Oleiphilus messinensis]ARU57739.1 arabinose-binding AraC family transcriptional regulator [Oleiphilus messinensis]